MPKTPTFKVGDKVAYSVQWLRSVGMANTSYAEGRGTVTDIEAFGDTSLVSIEWYEGEGASRVNAANLAHVGANRRFCAC